MPETFESIINELNYGDFRNKQKDITRLFPSFHDRANAVKGNGGVRLIKTTPGLWFFQIASGTKPGVKYDAFVEFYNIEKRILDSIRKKSTWVMSKKEIDFKRLAVEVLSSVDIKTYCDDPSDLYWGFQFIRTRKNAKYGKPEIRPPKIRNRKQRGFFCKHQQVLLEVLPMYSGDMVTFLKKFYGDVITKYSEDVKKSLFRKFLWMFQKDKEKE